MQNKFYSWQLKFWDKPWWYKTYVRRVHDSEKYRLWYKTTILMQIVLAHGKNCLAVIHRELRRTTKCLDLIKFHLRIQLKCSKFKC